MENKKIFWEKVATWSLILLSIFLPYSAYLVSVTGNQLWGLGRDICVLTLVVSGGFLYFLGEYRTKKDKHISPLGWLMGSILLFLIWMSLSFFWKEGGAAQWLRGWRHNGLPFIYLGLLVGALRLPQVRKQLSLAVMIGSIGPLVAGWYQLLGGTIPMGDGGSSLGSLGSVHFVGSLSLQRVSSIVAGPNALGIYLVFLILAVYWFAHEHRRTLSVWMIYLAMIVIMPLLILTYSRSALLGGLVVLLGLLISSFTTKFPKRNTVILAIGTFGILFVHFYLEVPKMISSKGGDQIISHDSSSSLRIAQYRRVWNERGEIGWLGRGVGMAGQSSQQRLDGGPNYWTENSFLDMYEQLGIIGLILYISIWVWVGFLALKQKGPYRTIAVLAWLACIIISQMIAITTGEVGLYLGILLLSLGSPLDEPIEPKRFML